MDMEQTACHCFEYTLEPSDFQRSFVVCNRKRFLFGRIYLFAGILFFLVGLLIPAQSTISCFVGALLIVFGIFIIRNLKQQQSKLPTCTPVYRWELYETEFAVSVYRDGKLSSYFRQDYAETIHAWRYDDRYVLYLRNALYILPVSVVPKNSPLHTAIHQKLKVHKDKTTLEKWGVGLFWGSIASLFLSAWTALLLPDYFGGYGMQYMRLMWLALPIPLACLVVGFVLKKRGHTWKKNVVCGIIIAALLLLFGSYSFLFQPQVDNGADYLAKVEQETGIVFPESDLSYVSNYVTIAPGNANIFILSSYYGTFSSYDARILNQQLPSDRRWSQEIPYGLLPCIPLNEINADSDFFLLYDATTRDFNTMPTTQGVHTMFYITYSSQYGSLDIVEYEFICN